jgi:hypothetical protein
VNPAKLNDKFNNFADLVCVDLFTLADIDGKNQSFLNCVDKASGYQLVAPVIGKRPDEVFQVFNRTWLIPFGIPHHVLSDNGGEFDREFADLTESLGSTILRSASYAPTQNGTTERRGGAWKAHARAVMDEHSVTFNTLAVAEHLCAAVNWAVNQDIDESGYSPAQWVLGRGLRLPYSMLATHGQLAAQTRLGQDPDFTRRVGLLAAAKRSVASLRYSRGLSKAFSARGRAEASVPAKWTYNVGDQIFYWRGSTKNKAQWMHRWLGPGVIIGIEANN